ncbi:MAG TPA: DUF2721 domain-containing protein, partial [Thermoanaerobaculia bacterium]
ILISGIGLLLLSMTNRLGRVVDRSRELARENRASLQADRERIPSQLAILMRRAYLLRSAIAAASASVLCAAVLIIVLFVGALLHLRVTAPLVGGLFVVCMSCVIGSLAMFIVDINMSLRALRIEIDAAT